MHAFTCSYNRSVSLSLTTPPSSIRIPQNIAWVVSSSAAMVRTSAYRMVPLWIAAVTVNSTIWSLVSRRSLLDAISYNGTLLWTAGPFSGSTSNIQYILFLCVRHSSLMHCMCSYIRTYLMYEHLLTSFLWEVATFRVWGMLCYTDHGWVDIKHKLN